MGEAVVVVVVVEDADEEQEEAALRAGEAGAVAEAVVVDEVGGEEVDVVDVEVGEVPRVLRTTLLETRR